MNQFTILAHSVKNADGDPRFSVAQKRLLEDPANIRVCGAPTGAGKTHAFLEIAKTQLVLFVVPTQALAADIVNAAEKDGIPYDRWDATVSKKLAEEGHKTWQVRAARFHDLKVTGGIVVATLEALAILLLGQAPVSQAAEIRFLNILSDVDHLVFDEAHTLNERAYGLLHIFITLLGAYNAKTKLTLLSATHSNLFEYLETDLPAGKVSCFDEAVETGILTKPEGRLIHGNVTVHCHETALFKVIKEQAPQLLPQLRAEHCLLIIYDSLFKFSEDETALATLFKQCGVEPHQVLLVNGQDKHVEQSLGASGFEGGLVPQPHHKVIIGTSAVEMGVNFKVDLAIMEHGNDAAAFLQRVGRIARFRDETAADGVVHVCQSSLKKTQPFYNKLLKIEKDCEIEELREKLKNDKEQLRSFNIGRAKLLGNAYWSMLNRKHKNLLRDTMQPAYKKLFGEDLSHSLLDKLHVIAMEANKNRTWNSYEHKNNFESWLNKLDKTLEDVRGFCPTVLVEFKVDGEFVQAQYNEDWIRARLINEFELIEVSKNQVIYRFDKPRSECLKDKLGAIWYSVFSPFSGLASIETQFSHQLEQAYVAKVKASGNKRMVGYEEALQFIKSTGLIVREETIRELDQESASL